MRANAGLAATLRAGALVALAIALAGCGGRYGSIRWDAAAGRSFETGQVLAGHRVYTWGPETWPDGILAIRSDRRLAGAPWHETTLTPQTLARLIDRMRGTRTAFPDGYAVLDDRGERIGAWYSLFAPPPTVTILEDGAVHIPHPFQLPDDPPRPTRP